MSTELSGMSPARSTLRAGSIGVLLVSCLLTMWSASMLTYGGVINTYALFYGVAWSGAGPGVTLLAATCTAITVTWIAALALQKKAEACLFWANVASHCGWTGFTLFGTDDTGYWSLCLGITAAAGALRVSSKKTRPASYNY